MNQELYEGQQLGAQTVPEAEISLLDWLIAFANHKKVLIGMPIVCAVSAALISLTMPNVYKANTKILPPQQAQSGAAALLAQLGGVANVAAGAAGIKNPNDLYIGMLKSRTIADALIGRFNLRAQYDERLWERTRKKLATNTAIASAKDGLINIEVEDTDPKRAMELANAYADELLKLTKRLAVTEAGQRRLFFEQQLQTAKDKLFESESKLKSSLDKNGVISVDAQSRAIVETIARVRAQLAAKEIQLSASRAVLMPEHPEYKRLEAEIAGMRRELQRLENGNAAATDGNASEDGLANMKLLRDVKYYQMLYELLSKQYEVARLDETKDASIVQVLDKAVEPERKIKPGRVMMTVAFGVLGFLFAVVWVVVIENLRRNTDPSQSEKLELLKSSLGFGNKTRA